MPFVEVAIAFAERNLTSILFVLLTASVSFSLGMLTTRRRVERAMPPAPATRAFSTPLDAYTLGFAQGLESGRYNFVNPHTVRHLQHLLHRLKDMLMKLKEWHDKGQLFFIPARGLLLFILEELEEYYGKETWYREIRSSTEKAKTIEEIVVHAGHLASRLANLI